MADIQIPYLPATGNGDFDLKLQEVIDILRYYVSEHDTSLTTLEAATYVNYVDRGDASAVDFAVGDLTTDGTWRDLNLASIVTAGAKAVHIRAAIQDDAVSSILSFRENGNSNAINLLRGSTQRIDETNYIDGLVTCDSNRIIEYNATNLTWTAINITVRGWFI